VTHASVSVETLRLVVVSVVVVCRLVVRESGVLLGGAGLVAVQGPVGQRIEEYLLAPGTFREHSGNIQGTFREHSGNIQGTFREHSGNIQ
jgi:hypothetical protein